MLSDSIFAVRIASAITLCKFKDRTAIKPLKTMLMDSRASESEIVEGVKELVELGEKRYGGALLTTVLESSKREKIRKVTMALVQLVGKETVANRLRKILTDKYTNSNKFDNAVFALEEILSDIKVASELHRLTLIDNFPHKEKAQQHLGRILAVREITRRRRTDSAKFGD